jgi:hypothetical protein
MIPATAAAVAAVPAEATTAELASGHDCLAAGTQISGSRLCTFQAGQDIPDRDGGKARSPGSFVLWAPDHGRTGTSVLLACAWREDIQW